MTFFKVLEENCQPRILYLAKVSFKNKGERHSQIDSTEAVLCQ